MLPINASNSRTLSLITQQSYVYIKGFSYKLLAFMVLNIKKDPQSHD